MYPHLIKIYFYYLFNHYRKDVPIGKSIAHSLETNISRCHKLRKNFFPPYPYTPTSHIVRTLNGQAPTPHGRRLPPVHYAIATRYE
ncbi:MAG: hypothetical protein SAL70_28940 [Scytonema sp. PMC 1070.18]|nr:hypothetical protein [Scytonema sp. PMC 1070.18]